MKMINIQTIYFDIHIKESIKGQTYMKYILLDQLHIDVIIKTFIIVIILYYNGWRQAPKSCNY